MHTDSTVIYIDGASRGNPGPAAFAFVIPNFGPEPIERCGPTGYATNNVAEYDALLYALAFAAQIGIRKPHVLSDSELVVNQMKGRYAIRRAHLRQLHAQAQDLVAQFDSVSFAYIRREFNWRADQLCNWVLDCEAANGYPFRPHPVYQPPYYAMRQAARIGQDQV